MKILTYGAGAVGLGLSSCLLKSGHRVDIIARPKTALALKTNGFIRRGIFGFFKAAPNTFDCYTSLHQIKPSSYDFILVTTKTFDSKPTAKDIAKHPFLLNEKTKIILFQNGWGNAEIFASYLPKKQIYNARVITGFIRPKPNEVTITVHAEDISVGSLFQGNRRSIEILCKEISKGDVPCRSTNVIEKDLWAKMLYNGALNPLGAILNVSYGTLAEYAFTRNMMNDLICEIFSVMTKAGYQTHWKTAEEYLKYFYSKQLPPTARHTSSMLQDIKAKKRTEIDAINGIIVRLAKTHHIAASTNHTIFLTVKLIEKIYSTKK